MCKLNQGMKNGKGFVCSVLEKSDIYTQTYTHTHKSKILLDTIYHIHA